MHFFTNKVHLLCNTEHDFLHNNCTTFFHFSPAPAASPGKISSSPNMCGQG